VKIDREVEAHPAQPPAEREVGRQTAEPRTSRRHEHLTEVWIGRDDGCGGRLDEVGETRARKVAAERGNRRRGEHHVADLPEPHEEDLQSAIINWQSSISRLDRGFVDEHHRNVILDRIHTLARLALERGAVLD
jgi:hypothetical protein